MWLGSKNPALIVRGCKIEGVNSAKHWLGQQLCLPECVRYCDGHGAVLLLCGPILHITKYNGIKAGIVQCS